LEKTKRVPAVGVLNGLKTRSDIRPGMINDIIRIPIYQGDYEAEGTNPLLNNLVNEVIITGENLPAFLPEGSDVDITIKVDRSQIMQFSAYFPLLNHTEELELEIKPTEAPEKDFLVQAIANAKKSASKVSANEIEDVLINLDEQLEREGGSPDGRMKIQNDLRKELLKLDSAEKETEWPKVQQELKDSFYEFENLIKKIKDNSDGEDLNLSQLESHIQEYKTTIEQIIKDKNLKAAKEITEEIDALDTEIRNEVSGGAMDVNKIKYHDREFNNLRWKDKTKARQLINQGLQLITDGRTRELRPILHQIWDLRIDAEGPREILE